MYDTSPATGKPLTTHQFYDGTQHPWEFKRVWHLEPALTIRTRFMPALRRRDLRTTDGGKNWRLAGLRPGTGPNGSRVQAARRTIVQDSKNPGRMYIAISAAGVFRTDDGGKTWSPRNRGLTSKYLPDPTAEVGFYVHRIAMHPSRPNTLFMQLHWHVCRSDDAGENWQKVSGNLPSDFGFPVVVHAQEPNTVYVVPILSDSLHYPPDGKLRVYRSRTGGNEWEALTKGLPQSDCYVNILRGAMSVDTLDPCGIYFGTTGGQVYASADGGDNWAPIARTFRPGLLVGQVL